MFSVSNCKGRNICQIWNHQKQLLVLQAKKKVNMDDVTVTIYANIQYTLQCIHCIRINRNSCRMDEAMLLTSFKATLPAWEPLIFSADVRFFWWLLPTPVIYLYTGRHGSKIYHASIALKQCKSQILLKF